MTYRWKSVFGVGVAFSVVGVLVWIAGVDKFVATVLAADPVLIGTAGLLTVVWLGLWGTSFYVVLTAIGITVSLPRAIFGFATVTFANNMTPFGQAGGEPVAAGFISETLDEPYERCLASISTIDAINFIPSILLVSASSVYLVIENRSLLSTIDVFLYGFGGLLVAFLVALTVVFRFDSAVTTRLSAAVHTFFQTVGRVPRVPTIEKQVIQEKVSEFVSSARTVATDRQTVGAAVLFSLAGFLTQVAVLWIAVRAVGATVPFAILLFALPISLVGSVAPLPGGVGGVETALVGLITLMASLPLEQATAAVIVMRGFVYWLPIVIGVGTLSVSRLRTGE